MRFGLDVSQQRLAWPEIASRVRFGDEAGFAGVWGFDHFQPMYGEGPGECFEGMTTLAAWSGIATRARLGLLGGRAAALVNRARAPALGGWRRGPI